jgi:hypothetical protein
VSGDEAGGFDDHGQDWGGDGPGSRSEGDDDDREYPQVSAGGVTLREHLIGQLAGTGCSRRDRALVTVLVEELDGDGYLRLSLEEVLQALPAELDIEPEELSGALKLLQSFDPVGVAARSSPGATRRSRCCAARPRSPSIIWSCSRCTTSRGSSACCAATTTCCATPRR